MQGGFIYRDEHGNKIYKQHHNGGKMFGFATKKDWNKWIGKANGEFNKAIAARFQALREEMLERLEELKPKVEQPQAPEPVETNGKLWTITITRDGEPHPERYVWKDCTGYNHERYFDGAISGISIRFKNGATAYKTGRWNVEMTEQKAEAEKASFDCGGVSWLSQIDRHIDRLLDQPVNVRRLTLAREEMEREWTKKYDRVSRVVSGLATDVCLLQGDVSTLKEVTRDQAKTIDALTHRIEMLELRLNGADKQAKAQPTKGAKR